MAGIILLNGEPYNLNITKNAGDVVVCCDGAYSWAQNKIAIDVVLGDFDSLSVVPKGAIVYPAEKNYTDGELAVRYLINKNIKDIKIYGGGGGREDHFLGNISLLYLILKRGGNAVMINNECRIVLANKSFGARSKSGNIVSIVPFTNSVHINESTGLKYSCTGLVINKWSTRGISNIQTEKDFFIKIKKGIAIIVYK